MKPQFKANSMMQWVECNWNKIFVNLSSLPWKFEISGAVHLAQLGLTAGRPEYEIHFEFFFLNSLYPLIFRFFNQCMASLEQY